MKKLLALVLVLALAASAQAGFVLSMNGDMAPDEVTIMPSDTFVIDISITPGTEFNGGDFGIRLSNDLGTLNSAQVVFPSPTIRSFTFGNWFVLDEQAWQSALAPFVNTPVDFRFTGGHSQFNAINNVDIVENPFGQPTAPALSYPTLMDGLEFHCVAEGDVIIELVALADVTMWANYDAEGNPQMADVIAPAGVLDSIIVHQIPEPMTLSLLAMGGLALLRRRR